MKNSSFVPVKLIQCPGPGSWGIRTRGWSPVIIQTWVARCEIPPLTPWRWLEVSSQECPELTLSDSSARPKTLSCQLSFGHLFDLGHLAAPTSFQLFEPLACKIWHFSGAQEFSKYMNPVSRCRKKNIPAYGHWEEEAYRNPFGKVDFFPHFFFLHRCGDIKVLFATK